MSNPEACRIVGTNRSSGTRWRHGQTVVLKSGDIKTYAPISQQRPAGISAVISPSRNRFTIADLLHARRSTRAIARQLGCSPSTVSTEISRNLQEPSGNYRPQTALRSAERRRSRQRTGKIASKVPPSSAPGAVGLRLEAPRTAMEPPPDRQPAV